MLDVRVRIIYLFTGETLHITCDDRIDEIYIDGKSYDGVLRMPGAWSYVESITIPSNPGVIAVKCSDTNLARLAAFYTIIYSYHVLFSTMRVLCSVL